MPMEVFTDAALVSITGPVTIVKEPKDGTNGSLTVAGAVVASSTLAVSGVLTAASGVNITGALVASSTLVVSGAVTAATGLTISAGGLTVTGGGSLDQLWGGLSATAVAVATSGTISASTRISRVNPAAAVTAMVMASGTTNGQTVTISNEAAGTNTVTFAASATSNVMGGTGVVISGLTNRILVWNGSLWN